MSSPTSVKTLGVVTFSSCGEPEQMLFRVNADVPLQQALEHASTLLYYAKKLALDAAMGARAERYAWALHFLAEMGKAVVDDVGLGGQEAAVNAV